MKKKVGITLGLAVLLVGLGIAGGFSVKLGIIQQNNGKNDYFSGSQIISEVVVSSANAAPKQWEQTSIPADIQGKYLYQQCYAYGKLDETQQTIYQEILQALNNMDEDVLISSTDVEQVIRIHQYVCQDNPELFWVKGYKIVPYEMAGKTVKVKYSGIYTMTKGEKENYQIAMEQKTNQWLAEIAGCQGDYEKVKKAYELIILNTSYDTKAEESQNVLSVFLNGSSVCQGYAEAFQYLCKHAGIQNILVTGQADNSQGMQPHAWNMVKMDNSFYQFDITWGEPNYQMADTVTEQVKWDISYKYFAMTDAEMKLDHTIDMEMEISLPKCNSTENNYYIHEGYYYETLDKRQLKLQFLEAEKAGTGVVHLRCDNDLLYQEFVKYLIEDSKVFYIINGHTQIQYSLDEELRCISIFWDI